MHTWFVSVSYTHLDVYKRQGYYRRSRQRNDWYAERTNPNNNNNYYYNNGNYRHNYMNRNNYNNEQYNRPNNHNPNNNNQPNVPNNHFNRPNNQNQAYRRVNYMRAEDNGRGRRYYQRHQSFNGNSGRNNDHDDGRNPRNEARRARSSEDYRRVNCAEDNHQPEARPEGNGNQPQNPQDRREEEADPL